MLKIKHMGRLAANRVVQPGDSLSLYIYNPVTKLDELVHSEKITKIGIVTSFAMIYVGDNPGCVLGGDDLEEVLLQSGFQYV
jgi:hypothetical protein